MSGNGDVLEPFHGVMGIGSGGHYAQAAALALLDVEGLDAETIARRAMKIAGDMCIYTNNNLTMEKLIKSPAHVPTLQSTESESKIE